MGDFVFMLIKPKNKFSFMPKLVLSMMLTKEGYK